MDLLHKPLFEWNLIDYAVFTAVFLVIALAYLLLADRVTRRPK